MSEVPTQLYIGSGEYPGLGRVSEEAALIEVVPSPEYRAYDPVITELNFARFGGEITDVTGSNGSTKAEKRSVGPNITRVAELLAELGENLVVNCQSVEEIRDKVAIIHESIQFTDNEYYILANRIYAAQRRQELARDIAKWNAEKATNQNLNNSAVQSSEQHTVPQHIVLPDVVVGLRDEQATIPANEVHIRITPAAAESSEQSLGSVEALFKQLESTLKAEGNSAFSTDSVPNEAFKVFQVKLRDAIWIQAGKNVDEYAKLYRAASQRVDQAFITNHLESIGIKDRALEIVPVVVPLKAETSEGTSVASEFAQTTTSDAKVRPQTAVATSPKQSGTILKGKPDLSPKELQSTYEGQLREWADKNRNNVDTIDKLNQLFNKQKAVSIKQGWTRKEYNNSPVADAIFGIMTEELWARTGAKTSKTDVFNAELPVLKQKVYEKPSKIEQTVVTGKKVHKQVQRIGYRALDMGQNYIESRRKSKN